MGVEGKMFAEESVVNTRPLNKGKCRLHPGLFKTLNVKTSYLEESCRKRWLDGHRPRVTVEGRRGPLTS